MSEKQDWPGSNGYVIVFSAFSFFIYIVLFFLRSFDDNRTTSWQDIFTVASPAIVFSILVICIMAAWLISKLSLAERYFSIFLAGSSFAVAACSGMSLKLLLMPHDILSRQSILSCMEWDFSSGNGEGPLLYGQTCR